MTLVLFPGVERNHHILSHFCVSAYKGTSIYVFSSQFLQNFLPTHCESVPRQHRSFITPHSIKPCFDLLMTRPVPHTIVPCTFFHRVMNRHSMTKDITPKEGLMTWRERKSNRTRKNIQTKKLESLGLFANRKFPGSGKHKPLSLK